MKILLASVLIIPLLLAAVPSAFAHNETEVGDIKIVGGWGIEPPLIGQLNTVVLEVSHVSDGKPITNAFAFTTVTVKKGGLTKELEVEPAEEPGHYKADIIPTQLGQYAVVIDGTIATQQIKSQIEIEDVEDSAGLNFPPGTGSGDQGLPKDFVDQLRLNLNDLTTRVDDSKAQSDSAQSAAQQATEIADELKGSSDRAFLVGIVGVGVGVAGIAVAAIALSKRS
jgi:hypothetical protein